MFLSMSFEGDLLSDDMRFSDVEGFGGEYDLPSPSIFLMLKEGSLTANDCGLSNFSPDELCEPL